ncbi:hypothetical protein CLV24_102150 [Pontibacter ummariensis]|uniref:Uncharacterized protein n=1 Tax=Pontibacter ummariensis TaxID=1610492 RepID=A0A239C096_9BACT|nr:hypothetical protein [Pontibacter ummariensis]PRY15529.1 hypothetical protein CLV24_102150 [Pontibacter ummariensis]SNS13339.1 hypothetical protein SAMN06296052_102262 [Pontibacter ummariensis]
MTDKSWKTFEDYEQLLQQGLITCFAVYFKNKGLLLTAIDGPEEEVPLPEDMLQSVTIYFYGLGSVSYGTSDYDSLKSLLNTRTILKKLL